MSNKNKLEINKDASPNGDPYIDSEFVVENGDNKRIGRSLRISATSMYESPGMAFTVDIDYGDRIVQYGVDYFKPIHFDEKTGTVEFTEGDRRYKIRAIQDSDKSWLGAKKPAKTIEES